MRALVFLRFEAIYLNPALFLQSINFPRSVYVLVYEVFNTEQLRQPDRTFTQLSAREAKMHGLRTHSWGALCIQSPSRCDANNLRPNWHHTHAETAAPRLRRGFPFSWGWRGRAPFLVGRTRIKCGQWCCVSMKIM